MEELPVGSRRGASAAGAERKAGGTHRGGVRLSVPATQAQLQPLTAFGQVKVAPT